jgi:hypothetical protein
MHRSVHQPHTGITPETIGRSKASRVMRAFGVDVNEDKHLPPGSGEEVR